MTNEEFLERIYATASSVSPFETYSAEEIENKIRSIYSGTIDTTKIIERFLNIGSIFCRF